MQNYFKIVDRKQLIGLLIVGSVSLCFFSLLFWLNIYTDIQGHIEQIQAMAKGELIRGNFLYYLVVWLLALGQTKSIYLAVTSIFVLTAAVIFKYQITVHYLNKHKSAAWIALALVFAFSLPGPDYLYRGQIPPNIWHNSTTIFLMPFALLLFIEAETYLQSGQFKSLKWVVLLIALNIFIKPSFFFCIGVVLPGIAVIIFGFKKGIKDLIIPIGLGWLLVVGQYVLTYSLDPSTTDSVSGAGVQIAPLLVWRANSSMIGLSLLASLAFPASVVLLRLWRRGHVATYCNTLLQGDNGCNPLEKKQNGCNPLEKKQNGCNPFLPWALLAFGILMYIFIAETGERALHGNFAWQNMVCMYMLFLSCSNVLQYVATGTQRMQYVATGTQRMQYVATGLLALHVISGVAYLAKILITGSYF